MQGYDFSEYDAGLVTVRIDGTTGISINPEVELDRTLMLVPLLHQHGEHFANCPFDYDTYPHADGTDRCFDAGVKWEKEFGLIYVEGLLVITTMEGQIVPIGHGWCCTADGKIVDPTMHRYQHQKNMRYMGLRLSLDYVITEHKKTGYYGLIDGRIDKAPKGIYYDDSSLWLHRSSEITLEQIIGPK